MRRGRKWRVLTGAGLPVLAALSFGGLGCVGQTTVARVSNGHLLPGRFIGVDAYAAFLRGALAEQDGDTRGALAAYEAAARSDPDDPEILVRIGRMRCTIDREDAGADQAIHEALQIDTRYEPALLARGYCETLRARPEAAMEAFAQAAIWEPMGLEADVDAAHLGATMPTKGGDDELKARLLALTMLHGDRGEAWEALEVWATTHGDVELAVQAMVQVVRLLPGRRVAVGQSVIALASAGRRGAAERVAGALLDAPGDRVSGGEGKPPASVPLVARLAVDEAITRGDREKVLARAARAHLPAAVAAGRAWAHGDPKLAQELIYPTVRADPANLAARWVFDAVSGRLGPGVGTSAPVSNLPPEVGLPLARAVDLAFGAEVARKVLTGNGVRVLAGDALLTGLAVELATVGVLSDPELPADARVELAARRFMAPAEADVADPTLDDRHRLLGLSLLHPVDEATKNLGRRLASSSAADPLVAAALVNVALARHEAVSAPLQAALESFAATDPIAASALVELTHQSGAPAAVGQARRRLAALARTPAERQRSEQ